MKIETHLSQKVAIGFTLALLALVAIGFVAFQSTREFAESAAIVARTHQAITKLQEVLGDAVSAESEARGYIITGDETFLKLYDTVVTDSDKDMRMLRDLVTDPAIEKLLDQLGQLITNRLQRLGHTIETRKLQGFDAVPKISGPGKQMMDELRRVTDEIESRERELLAERDDYAKSVARRTIAVVIVGSLLAALVAAASVIILTADVAHRERLEKEVLEISEREQRRIGQDLHDGVCQQLTGISLLSRSLQQKLTDQEATDAGQITRLINESIEQTRRVTRGLHPVPDEPTGLMLALKELAETVHTTTKVKCWLHSPELVPIPDQAASTNLYRIAQEAVQNALRHGKPSSILIELRLDDHAIQMTVTDDGQGIPEHQHSKGLGLEIMNYRAHTIGATLDVRRGDTCGTVVACTLPRSSLN